MISYLLSTQTLISSLGPWTTTSIFFSAAQNLFTVWNRNRFTGTFNFMIYILCNLCENRQPVEIFILSCIGYIQSIPLYFSQFYNKVYSSLFFTICIQYITLYKYCEHARSISHSYIIQYHCIQFIFKMRTYI